jgi:hypothetical protein
MRDPEDEEGTSEGAAAAPRLRSVGIVGRHVGPATLLAGVLRLNRVSVSAVVSSREELRAVSAPPTVFVAYVQSPADVPFVREVQDRFPEVPLYVLDARQAPPVRDEAPDPGLEALSIPKPPSEIVAWVRAKLEAHVAEDRPVTAGRRPENRVGSGRLGRRNATRDGDERWLSVSRRGGPRRVAPLWRPREPPARIPTVTWDGRR